MTIDLIEFATAVEAMRKAQNDYFAHRLHGEEKQQLLSDSKVKEKAVDQMVKEILHTPSLF